MDAMAAAKLDSGLPSDRGGMIMRKRLLDLFRQHGEGEIYRGMPGGPLQSAAE